MKYNRAVLAPVLCVTLSACHLPGFGGAKQPVGQVVATVDGQEITVRDLNTELGGGNFKDPKARKAAEQAALRAIVTRRLLANAARAQGLDKTPDFAIQQRKAVDGLLAQSLAAKVVNSVPAPTREEAETLITAHPDSFAERKIFTVDQIRTARPGNSALLEKLKGLNTLEAVEALLTQEHIPYQRATADLDALALDPRLVDSIAKLPPSEVFVIASPRSVWINQTKSTRVQPFTGDPAVNFALQYLRRQHGQQAVQRELNNILTKGARSVQYNKAYAPPPPAKGAQAI